ncbi:Aldehyde/histidinol dehydrogenase [Aspergillus spectabilis]
MMMFILEIAPALVTGNTVMIKSAKATPLSALKICELIVAAGSPRGTATLVSGYDRTVGSVIAHHMDVDKVASTGSTATGRVIVHAFANSNQKKVNLELGGKPPEGASLHLGRKAINKDTGRYYIQLNIFIDVRPEMKIMRKEIFGHVVAISKFTSETTILEEANNIYGLTSACFTRDYERAIGVTNSLRAGTTWVNLYNLVHWSMSSGGYKESGIRRECGEAVLENYNR